MAAVRLYKSGKHLEIYDCNPYMTEYLYTHRLKSTEEQWQHTVSQLSESCWVYVGDLQYHISEQIVHSYFSNIGQIDRIIFGVNRNDPNQKIGFAFIKYLTHKDACLAVHCLNNTILLDKSLNVQLDPGFEEGRQFGRGKTGHQRYKEKERKLKQIEKKLTKHKFKQIRQKKQINDLANQLLSTNIDIDMHINNKEETKEELKDSNIDIDVNNNDNDIKNNEQKKGELKENTVNNNEENIDENKKEKQEKKMDKIEGSEFDIVLPQKKKRKLDPNIAWKLKKASRQIDQENWEKRKSNQRKMDEDFNEIINMMQNTMTDNNNNENDSKKNYSKENDSKENGKIDTDIKKENNNRYKKNKNNNRYKGRGRGRGKWRGRGRGRGRYKGKNRKIFVSKRNQSPDFDSLMQIHCKLIDENKNGKMETD